MEVPVLATPKPYLNCVNDFFTGIDEMHIWKGGEGKATIILPANYTQHLVGYHDPR